MPNTTTFALPSETKLDEIHSDLAEKGEEVRKVATAVDAITDDPQTAEATPTLEQIGALAVFAKDVALEEQSLDRASQLILGMLSKLDGVRRDAQLTARANG